MNKTTFSKILFVTLYSTFLLIVFLSRLQGISIRPMHCDEANQAYKTGILLEKGIYKYDPYEHHGPVLYYATIPILNLFRINQFKDSEEFHFRLIPLLFSILLFPAIIPMKKYSGTIAFLVSNLLLAISNAFFFYSRYYIHEIAFVLFSTLFVFFLWIYLNNKKIIPLILSAILLSLSFSTKETTIIVLFSTMVSFLITLLFTYTIQKYIVENQQPSLPITNIKTNYIHFLIFLISFIIPWLLFYSSFFTHWHGLTDFFKAYQNYLNRSAGEGSSGIHDKPWWYYLQILLYFNKTVGPVWTEGFIVLLSLVGIFSLLWNMIRIFIQKKCSYNVFITTSTYLFLSISFFLTFLILLIIPYKTPWNILFPFLGMIIFAGIGFQSLWQYFHKIRVRLILLVILLTGSIHLTYLTYQGNFIYYADISNPYVYAHTSTSLVKMMDRIYELSNILKKENKEPIVMVISSNNDYWPIPWYLRKIDKKGFWSSIPPSENIEAPFLIISPEFSEKIDEILSNRPYMKEMYSIRPGVMRYLYIEQSLWNKFIETRIKPHSNNSI